MTTKKEQEQRAKLDVKIEKAINKICAGKPSNIRPKKWGFSNDNEITLVYWFWYYENKKVEKLMDKIMEKIEKQFGVEVTACADTTEKLNWHYI